MILIISPKNTYGARRLVEESRKQKIDIRILNIEKLAGMGFKVDVRDYDCLYIRNPYLKGKPTYLKQMISVAKRFKRAGKKVVDANIVSGKLGQGKWADYLLLKEAGISIPKTQLFQTHPSLLTPHPYIFKWTYGMKGAGTFLIKSEDDVKNIPSYIPKKELMWQEFIQADFEYKVVCVGYKSVPVVLKFKMNKLHRPDFKNYSVLPSIPSASEESLSKGILRPDWNVGAQDGKVSKVVNLAQKASKLLGRELSKVDILEKDGKLYVLEVNRFPGLESFEKLTKANVYIEILGYLQKR